MNFPIIPSSCNIWFSAIHTTLSTLYSRYRILWLPPMLVTRRAIRVQLEIADEPDVAQGGDRSKNLTAPIGRLTCIYESSSQIWKNFSIDDCFGLKAILKTARHFILSFQRRRKELFWFETLERRYPRGRFDLAVVFRSEERAHFNLRLVRK